MITGRPSFMLLTISEYRKSVAPSFSVTLPMIWDSLICSEIAIGDTSWPINLFAYPDPLGVEACQSMPDPTQNHLFLFGVLLYALPNRSVWFAQSDRVNVRLFHTLNAVSVRY